MLSLSIYEHSWAHSATYFLRIFFHILAFFCIPIQTTSYWGTAIMYAIYYKKTLSVPCYLYMLVYIDCIDYRFCERFTSIWMNTASYILDIFYTYQHTTSYISICKGNWYGANIKTLVYTCACTWFGWLIKIPLQLATSSSNDNTVGHKSVLVLVGTRCQPLATRRKKITVTQ